MSSSASDTAPAPSSASDTAPAPSSAAAPAPSSAAAPAPSSAAAPAPLWARVSARAVDLTAVFFIQFILVVVQIFWFMDDVSRENQIEPWGRPFIATMTFIGLYGIYEIFFHTYAGGQTPGKILMSLEVVSRRHHRPLGGAQGRPPSLAQSVMRWPLAGVAFPLLFAPNEQLWFAHYKLWALALWLLPGITAAFTKDRLSLHDLVAGTRVVRHVQTEEEVRQLEDIKRHRKEVREKYGIGRLGSWNRPR